VIAELPDLRVAPLLAAYRSGKLSAVDVAELAHAAATAHAEATSAWIELVDRDRLMGWARELDAGPRDLPLFGVPVAIKDNIDLAGTPTTAACPPFAYVPERSATVVRRLRTAGALPMGKTNLDQFATGLVGTRSPYGACSSVFDPSRVSGGSSSGSAIVVADGVVSIALGTDTAGSGRVPAAFNGVFGVKPTRGLASTAGVVPACRSLDCVSVFAADADGGRRALAVIAGPDPSDPYSRAGAAPATGAPLRLGVPRVADLDGPSQIAWRRAVEAAAAVVDVVVEIDLEPFLEAGRLLYAGPWLAERHAAVGDVLARGGPGVDPVVRDVVLAGAGWTAADVFRGQGRLARLRARADRVWTTVDVLLVPTAPEHPTHDEVAADPIGVNERLGKFTTFANLLDLCGVAVPAGTRDDGLPFGVTLLGPAFADAAVLDLAARIAGGTPRRAANPTHMSESDPRNEPHVSGQELRAALATKGRSRPNPLMADESPAWEWTTDEQAELVELRASTATLEEQVDELRDEARAARVREHELRDALRQLAGARAWQRRTVLAELAARGLV
jgi:allophanate hydrolase